MSRSGVGSPPAGPFATVVLPGGVLPRLWAYRVEQLGLGAVVLSYAGEGDPPQLPGDAVVVWLALPSGTFPMLARVTRGGGKRNGSVELRFVATSGPQHDALARALGQRA